MVFGILIFGIALFADSLIISIYPVIHHMSNRQANDWLNNSTGAQFVYTLLFEGMLLGALYGFLKLYNQTFKVIGLKHPRWRDAMYGIIAVPLYYILYFVTVSVVSHFVPGLNVDQHQDIGFNDVHGVVAMLLTFISLVILPPLAEEIMFRGFLYSSFKKALPTALAVIFTSLIFASIHLLEGGSSGPLYIAAIDTFILSLVLIFLREKTGSLWASITLHGIKNGIAFVALFAIHLH